MLDDLKSMIDTSKSAPGSVPQKTFVQDSEVVSAQLHDMVEVYGFPMIRSWLTAWLRGKARTEHNKCPVCGEQVECLADNSDEFEVNLYYQCPACGWDKRKV